MESTEDFRSTPCLLIHYLSIPQPSDANSSQDENQDNESLRSEDAEICFKYLLDYQKSNLTPSKQLSQTEK